MTDKQREKALQHASVLRLWRARGMDRPVLLHTNEVGPLMLVLGHEDANKLYFDFDHRSTALAVYLWKSRGA